MEIYDLSKELFRSSVFPGDPSPKKEAVLTISESVPCNVTLLTFGSHNGTHMDAPKHFCKNGKSIDEIPLEKCVGKCKLISLNGTVTAKDIENALADGTERLLIKGDILISIEAARKMTEKGLLFLGVEGMTVGSMQSPIEVHLELLGHEVVILESAVMTEPEDGFYFLCSQPLKMAGLDGSPVRPILISLY